MSTFTWAASYNSSKEVSPRVKRTAFGDGYQQRIGDGINTRPRKWSLKFDMVTTATANAIENFLIARNGVSSFQWTDPDGYSTGKWVCPQWTRTPTGPGVFSMTMEFIEVFGE